MQHLEVSCAVRRFFNSLGFKGLMLYREIIAVCSQISTKHIIILCGQNVEFLSADLVVRTVTAGLLTLDVCWKDSYNDVTNTKRKGEA